VKTGVKFKPVYDGQRKLSILYQYVAGEVVII